MQWASYLMPGLRSKALEAYVELSIEKDSDFKSIQDTIMTINELTPEEYRQKFRLHEKGPADSEDVVSHLCTTFQQWIKVLKKDSYESL